MDGLNGASGLAGDDRDAELLVLMTGGDELVPAGMDAGGQAQHDDAGLTVGVNTGLAQLAHGPGRERDLIE